MNTLKNKVNLIGRLGVKPELQTIQGDYRVANFSLATNERYKNKEGEWQDNTQWHQLKAWGKIADRIVKLADKGSEIVVEGRLLNRQYQTKEGEKRYASEIEVNEFMVISQKIA